MTTASLFDKIRNIMNELEKSDMTKLGQAGSPAVEGSKHQTAKADDGTSEQSTGSHYEENTEFLAEDNIDEKPDLTSESQLGDANENLPDDLGATLADESETEQPKKTQKDETEHPAKATKTAFQKRLENSSLRELFDIAMRLIKEEATVKSAGVDTDVSKNREKMAEYLIAGLVKGAKEAADLTAGSIAALVKLAQELEEEEEEEEEEPADERADKEKPSKTEEEPERPASPDEGEAAGKALTEDELDQLEQYIKQLLEESDEEETKSEEEEGETEGKPERDILEQMANTPAETAGLQVPPEVATADNSMILNASVDAMSELGVTPDMLSKAGDIGKGLAKMASDWVFTGKYKPNTKRGQTHEVIKDYMKKYINELFKRSQK